jgi:hypothetical protein
MSSPEEIEPHFPREVGRCIYCSREAVTFPDDLSDEHVIPYAMCGEWELLRASCGRHREVTSEFEGIVLNRGGLKDMREVLGFKTYHKKRRKGQRQVSFQVGDERRTETLPVEDHHGAWVLPVYAPPTKLTGGEPADGVRVMDRVGKHRHAATRKLAERFGATAHHVSVVDPVAWAQMMAKIGYAFAVGCVGLDTFEDVYVLPTILEGGKLAGHYVGCREGPPMNPDPKGNVVTLGQSADRELIAYIRLFAEMGFPEYVVYVGRLRDTEYGLLCRDASRASVPIGGAEDTRTKRGQSEDKIL